MGIIKVVKADRLWGSGEIAITVNPIRKDRYLWLCISGPDDLVNRLFTITDINFGWPEEFPSQFKNIRTDELIQI